MTYSDLETALLAAGNALSSGALGENLRRFHPGRRGAPERFSFLAGMELNHPPPIQNTQRILYTAEMTRFDLHLSDEDHVYLAWVRDMVPFVQSLVDSWWGGINPDLRTLFVDGDDAPPLVLLNTMFPGTRVRKPPAVRRTASKLGVGSVELSALSRAARAAQLTPSYHVASQVAKQARSDSSLRRELLAERNRIVGILAVRRGRDVTSERNRIREAVHSAYSDASDGVRSTVRAMRAYNELVTGSIAFLLGYAEAGELPSPVVVEEEHPIAVRIASRKFEVHLTFTQPRSLATDATFRIEDGGPLDGLYLYTGAGFQASGGRSIVDRHGSRIRELEQAV